MNFKILILNLIISLSFSACVGKVLMPYEEEPLCNAGIGYGYCGSVSDVYDEKIKLEEYSKR